MTPEENLIVNRLKATYADVDEMEKVFDIVVHTLALREAEIERLKILLTQAADALDYSSDRSFHVHLIAELRKAAQ